MNTIKRSLRSERDETAAQWMEGIPWGGTSCQGRSERWEPGSRRSVQASKVATNRQARTRVLLGLKRRARLNGQVKTAAGMGTNPSLGWGLVVLCLSQRAELMDRDKKNNSRDLGDTRDDD